MASNDVKLTLTRAQRRLLDAAARPSGLKTGPWARSKLLELASSTPAPSPAPAAPISAPLPVLGTVARPIRTPEEARKALKPPSFTPDPQG